MRLILAAAILGAVWYLYDSPKHSVHQVNTICWQPFYPMPGKGHFVSCSELDRYENI